MVIYFARTDMTGNITKWFARRDEACEWAAAHYAEEGYVARVEVAGAQIQANKTVAILNGVDVENEVIWENGRLA